MDASTHANRKGDEKRQGRGDRGDDARQGADKGREAGRQGGQERQGQGRQRAGEEPASQGAAGGKGRRGLEEE